MKRLILNFLALTFLMMAVTTAIDEEDCELYAPNTMHEFCCDIHDENPEFLECEIKWHNKIHVKNAKDEMNLSFCISECVYNKTKYLGADRKSLHMKAIKHHLEEMHGDEESEALMYKTYQDCDKHATSLLEHEGVKKLKERLKNYNCHPYPGLVFECVSNTLILNCPPKKYHGSAQCDHAKEYLESCLKHKKFVK